MHTIYDVAKLAGVSTGTVSNVLNNSDKVAAKTAIKVKAAMRELNFIPNTSAKTLKSHSSKIIGVIAEDIGIIFTSSIIKGICDYCEENGYTINLCNLGIEERMKAKGIFHYESYEKTDLFKESLEKNLNMLLSSRICGLIYIGTHPRDVGHILPALSIPVVYAYAYTKNNDYCINYDDYQGARLAMDYLIAKGHTQIALISGPIDSVPTHKRMLAYQSALLEHDIKFRPEYIKTGHWQYEDGYQKCLEILKLNPRPTAIFAMSDQMAVGALKAIHDKGLRIPEDIALHGFDNLIYALYVSPSLTTIDLPLDQIGRETAKTIHSILTGVEPQKPGILLPCSHIARESA